MVESLAVFSSLLESLNLTMMEQRRELRNLTCCFLFSIRVIELVFNYLGDPTLHLNTFPFSLLSESHRMV